MRERKMSKSHSKGVIILIFGILAGQIVIYLFTLVYKSELSLKTGNIAQITTQEKSLLRAPTHERFKFDPNKLSVGEYIKLGFTQSQATSIIKYRTKIGKFKNKKDFSKLYVLSDSLYKDLESYLVFEDSLKGKVSNKKTIQLDNRAYKEAINELNTPVQRIIEINRADSAELVSLPGIGPYFASKIIKYREKLGGFATKEQLFDIYGIDEAKFEMFSSKIIVDTLAINKLEIANINEKDLAKHPYIGSYVARGIVRFREKARSSQCTLEELIANKIVKAEFASILRFYYK